VQRRDACPAALFSTFGDPSTRSSNSLAQGDRRERYRSSIVELRVLQEAQLLTFNRVGGGRVTCHLSLVLDFRLSTLDF